MCLDKLADFEVRQNWGWQAVYIYHDGELRQRYLHYERAKWKPTPIQCDKWQKDPKRYIIRPRNYQTGFHISLSKSGAALHTDSDQSPKKVFFRNVIAKGYQTFYQPKRKYKTIVARERYVCDKTDRPPKD